MEKARQHPALAAVALLVLAGCQTAAPVAAPEDYVWSHASDGAGHRLSFGAPDSDDVGVQFRCGPDDGIEIVTATAEGFESLRVRSGRHTSAYPLTPAGEDSDIGVGATIEQDPLLLHFTETGRLDVWTWKGWAQWNANSDAELAAVRAFAEACRIG